MQFTEPEKPSSAELTNVAMTSFTIKWDYNTPLSFTQIVVVLQTDPPIPSNPFVNCSSQRDTGSDKECIFDKEDNITHAQVHNLTPGKKYTISIYLSACGEKGDAREIKDAYTGK